MVARPQPISHLREIVRPLSVSANQVSAEYIARCISDAELLGHKFTVVTSRRPDLKTPSHCVTCTCGWEKKRSGAKLAFAHALGHVAKVLGLADDSELALLRTRPDTFADIAF